jgi:hypothetical protein
MWMLSLCTILNIFFSIKIINLRDKFCFRRDKLPKILLKILFFKFQEETVALAPSRSAPDNILFMSLLIGEGIIYFEPGADARF